MEAMRTASRRVTHAVLARRSISAGRPARGRSRPSRTSLALARSGERGSEAGALRLLGEIASHLIRPTSRRPRRTTRGPGPGRQLGMRPLVAHCHLGLGKLYRRTGDRAKAQEHLTTATTMYREMDMSFWLEKAEAERSELGADAVPAVRLREPASDGVLRALRNRAGGPVPACGFANPEGFASAVSAAREWPRLAAPPRQAPASRHPESYTPQHLAEKILTSKAALEGERKQVTVLFADLKGSMELLGRSRPRGGARSSSIRCSSG